MPFGKKSVKSKEKEAAAGYPTQSAYPTMAQPPPAPGQQQMYAAPPAYGADAPPPYTAQASGYQPPPQGYPTPPQGYGYAPAPQGYAHPPQGYAHPPQGYAQPPQGYAPPPQGYGAPQGYPQQPSTTVIVKGGFDAGARFDGVAQPNIPPPPPGCAPNPAQRAMSQGHNVVVTQRPGNFFDGGSDGGYVLF